MQKTENTNGFYGGCALSFQRTNLILSFIVGEELMDLVIVLVTIASLTDKTQTKMILDSYFGGKCRNIQKLNF